MYNCRVSICSYICISQLLLPFIHLYIDFTFIWTKITYVLQQMLISISKITIKYFCARISSVKKDHSMALIIWKHIFRYSLHRTVCGTKVMKIYHEALYRTMQIIIVVTITFFYKTYSRLHYVRWNMHMIFCVLVLFGLYHFFRWMCDLFVEHLPKRSRHWDKG